MSWSHYLLLLPIKDENKRNYYINLCINENLSKRELTKELKNNSYERLINKPEKIEIEIPHQTSFPLLGNGFALIDNQYKINYNNTNYFIDILLFNYKLNCFLVVELKLRELSKVDKAQIEFYMQIINKKIKEPFHNKTIGIIISKKQDKLIANFIESEEIITLTYQIQSKEKVEEI